MTALPIGRIRGANWRPSDLLLACAGALLLALLLVGAFTTDGFLTLDNARAVLSSMAFVGIMAVGATAITLSGSLFSVSLGTTVAITAMFFLYALKWGLVGALVTTAVLGAAIFALQGIAVGAIGANAIIVTIGFGAVQEGLATWLSPTSVAPPAGAPSISFLVSNYLGIPFPVYVLAVLAVIGELVMRSTTFGRRVYLVGENAAAALAAGIPTAWTTIGAFAFAGAAVGISGLLIGASNHNASLTVSGTFTFDTIAAILVGGTAVTGGRGSVLRSVGGAVVIATVSDMLLLRGYSTGAQILVKGLIVVIVVIAVHLRSHGRRD